MRALRVVLALTCSMTGAMTGAMIGADGTAHADLSIAMPDLVYIGPGLQVIADYDDPIFFSHGTYWRSDDGSWYRSASYTRGWEYVEVPPGEIRSIARPDAYLHYHPLGYVCHVRPMPQRHDDRYVVRSPPAHHPRVEPPHYVHPRPAHPRADSPDRSHHR